MPMIEEMEAEGRWLFRWRSYLPLATVIWVLAALQQYTYPFSSHTWGQVWELFCLGLSLMGLLVRILTVGFTPKGTSGRNAMKQVADTLNTSGMYSIVRNPIYLGNFLVGFAVSLFPRVWWLPVIYALGFTLYYERIVFAEEMFLRQKFGELYMKWAAGTPAFLPRMGRWRPPERAFDWRKVCRQEHQTLFGIVTVFYIMDLITDWHLGHGMFLDDLWNILFSSALALFVMTRILRKYTRLLREMSPVGLVLGLLLPVAVARAGEERVPLEEVPKAVLEAVKARFDDADVTGACMETEAGLPVYEITLEHGGAGTDVILTPVGELLSIEREIAARDLPEAIVRTLDGSYPRSTVDRVEEIVKLEEKQEKTPYYEVLLATPGGKALEVQITADGRIMNEENERSEEDDE